MLMVCLDLEGVLVPEIWLGLAERTGIEALRVTTRDVADYDELMRHRLAVLEEHGLGMAALRAAAAEIRPYAGARELLDWIRERFQLVILSDTFDELARPLMAQLGWPTLFCHQLVVDASDHVSGYHLRLQDHKTAAVVAFQQLNFRVAAAGDSYNDTGMLNQADMGSLFCPPTTVREAFPHLPVVNDYATLRTLLTSAAKEASPEP